MASLLIIIRLISCTAFVSDFSAATASKVHAIHLQGPQAHQAGVVFPKEQGALDRTLIVSNLNPSVGDEQVCVTPPLGRTVMATA